MIILRFLVCTSPSTAAEQQGKYSIYSLQQQLKRKTTNCSRCVGQSRDLSVLNLILKDTVFLVSHERNACFFLLPPMCALLMEGFPVGRGLQATRQRRSENINNIDKTTTTAATTITAAVIQQVQPHLK